MDTDILARLGTAFADRPVLITGGASFIGSHLAELLLRVGATVTVADDLSSGKLEHLAAIISRISFLKGDLRRPDFAREASARKKIIFHLAACHGGRGYIDTHSVECCGNMGLDHTVFSAAVAGGAEKIVFASSACVYPTTFQSEQDSRILLKESDANFDIPGGAFADGEYGWAKLMGELQLRAFAREFGISGVACRIFTAYGERENESHAVIALIAKAKARLDPFPIWGNGRQTRNITYVHDTVTGIALAGACLHGFETINIGTNTHHTILELVQEICRCVGWEPKKIDSQLDKPIGVNSRAADITKCRDRLAWVPAYNLRDGVRRTVDWYTSAVKGGDLASLAHRLMERV